MKSRNTMGGTRDITKSNYCNRMQDLMYHTNGTGRDTYIFSSNGGFAMQHRPGVVRIDNGKFLPSIKGNASPQKYPALAHNPMPRRYKHNGTGRDGYIANDNGGFSVSGQMHNREPHALFKGILR